MLKTLLHFLGLLLLFSSHWEALSVKLLNGLGTIYRAQGRVDRARLVIGTALKNCANNGSPEYTQAYTALCCNMGELCSLRSDFGDAERYLNEGLAHGSDADDMTRAQLYNNLGELMRRTGKVEKAKANHSRALALRLTCVGPLNPAVGETLNNVGTLCYQSTHFDLAEGCLKASLAIVEWFLGSHHKYVALCQNNVGMALAKMNRWDDAIKYLTDAKTCMSARRDPDLASARAIEKNLSLVEQAQAQRTQRVAVDSSERPIISVKNVAHIERLFSQLQTVGSIVIEKVEHMDSKRITIGSGATVNAPVTIADTIQDSFNMLDRATIEPGRKALMEQLVKAVTEASPQVSEVHARALARDASDLTKESTSSEPCLGVCRSFLSSLTATAKAVGVAGAPILKIAADLMPLLTPGESE